MDYNNLIEYYKNNHEKKIFHTKITNPTMSYHIMYIYDFKKELEYFKTTFLYYLPFYVRNSDQLKTIEEINIEAQLESRSKKIRVNEILPKRKIEVNGIYGELFLDFYLRIVEKRKCFITYAQKRAYKSNLEAYGPDNVVYYIDAGVINICFCEAKFVDGAYVAKSSLVEDISGKTEEKPSHLSKEYLNEYIGFIIGKQPSISLEDKIIFKDFINELNKRLDTTNDFIDAIVNNNVIVNFIFFAIFDSTKKEPKELENHYIDIYNAAIAKIKTLGIENYKIEIIFIPTDNKTITIKREIDSAYE